MSTVNGGSMDVAKEFEFLERVINLIKKERILNPSEEDKVVEFVHPAELEKKINLSIGEPCGGVDELENICKEVIKYSVKTRHPNFHNQLYGGIDLYGFTGTILSESLNTNQHTFEVAPVFSLIESIILNKLYKVVGYDIGDGIFCPGGSISNMYAMVLARHKKFPDIKTKGFSRLPTLTAFTSEGAHYSLVKAAHWLGIGTDNLIKIKTDAEGKMIPEELETEIQNALERNHVPFFVNATAGTTVLGSIDPLESISIICQKYNLWMHIDACYGGTLMFSSKYKGNLKGMERSDSLSWNPHKMLGAPLQCSIFVTSHCDLMKNCNSTFASYLFQPDKFYDVTYDTGDKSIQCGRKVDCFKLWVMWKMRGDIGFETLIDNAMDCARYFKNQIMNREGFRLVQDKFETSTVCFWYIPQSFRGKEENKDWWEKVDKVVPLIKESLLKSGNLMIGYSPLPHRGLCNFFRMVTTCHPPPTHQDMDIVIKQIEIYGNLY